MRVTVLGTDLEGVQPASRRERAGRGRCGSPRLRGIAKQGVHAEPRACGSIDAPVSGWLVTTAGPNITRIFVLLSALGWANATSYPLCPNV